jgi:putative transposase
MKKSRFTEQQIAFALQQAETGTSVEEVCRKLGISQATFFRWKKVYGGLMPSEVRKLKHLEEENARLRKLVADLTVDKEMLSEVIKKSSDLASRPRDDRLRSQLLQGLCETGVSRSSRLQSHLPLPLGPAEPGAAAQAHSRDRRDAGPLWIPPHPHRSAARGLACEREAGTPSLLPGRPANAAQTTTPAGYGQAAG